MSPGDLLSAGSSLAEHPPQDDRGPWSLQTRVSIGTPKVEGLAHFEGVGGGGNLTKIHRDLWFF